MAKPRLRLRTNGTIETIAEKIETFYDAVGQPTVCAPLDPPCDCKADYLRYWHKPEELSWRQWISIGGPAPPDYAKISLLSNVSGIG